MKARLVKECVSAMGLRCCNGLYKCRKQILGPLWPTAEKLWKENANPLGYCRSGIIGQLNEL